MKRTIAVAALTIVLAGCVSSGVNKESVSAKQLAQQHFILDTVNGQAVTPGDHPAEIGFDDDMQVSGSMCNRFTGKGKLSDGTLTVKELAMTRMVCADPQRNALDTTIGAMLREGAQVDLTDNQLTLTTADQTLIYKRQDNAQ